MDQQKLYVQRAAVPAFELTAQLHPFRDGPMSDLLVEGLGSGARPRMAEIAGLWSRKEWFQTCISVTV